MCLWRGPRLTLNNTGFLTRIAKNNFVSKIWKRGFSLSFTWKLTFLCLVGFYVYRSNANDVLNTSAIRDKRHIIAIYKVLNWISILLLSTAALLTIFVGIDIFQPDAKVAAFERKSKKKKFKIQNKRQYQNCTNIRVTMMGFILLCTRVE